MENSTLLQYVLKPNILDVNNLGHFICLKIVYSPKFLHLGQSQQNFSSFGSGSSIRPVKKNNSNKTMVLYLQICKGQAESRKKDAFACY